MEKSLRKAVMAVFVNENNEVLIGNSPRDGGFKFPQGGMDLEESPKETLLRELNEELGIILDEKLILKEYEEKVIYLFPENLENSREFRGQELCVFKIKYDTSIKFIPQDDEFDKLIWIASKDLGKYDTKHRFPAYKKALRLCGLL